MARKPKPPPPRSDGKNEHDLLAAHAHRKIRAFLIEPDRGNHSNTRVFDAFWAVVYGYTLVDHATAVAVERELMASTRTVQEVLDGWRPEALTADPRTEASRYACPTNYNPEAKP